MKKKKVNGNEESVIEKPYHSRTEKIVESYHQTEKELKEFVSEIQDIYEELYLLVEERNRKLDEAIRAVKSELSHTEEKQIIVNGIGATKRYNVSYDIEYLLNNLPGRVTRLFLKPVTTYVLDVKALEAIVDPEEVAIIQAAKSCKESSRASLSGTPKPYLLPDTNSHD